MNFSDFDSVESYLNSLINYEHDFPLGGNRNFPKLEPVIAAVEQLGLTQILPNCIHIAGTKGKGSTVAYLESLLKYKYKTLSFTSPHLVSVKERVKLNGELLSDEIWQQGVSVIAKTPKTKLTYFETTFVFYMWAARELETNTHLVETGLGGRWDATNILQDTIAVLTLVDYDHTKILGSTLTEIASEKAGIIKPNSQVVVSSQHAESMIVFQKALTDKSANSHFLGKDFVWQPMQNDEFGYKSSEFTAEKLKLNLYGDHQKNNAAVAIRAARLIDVNLSETDVRNSLKCCIIPARQQYIRGKPDILLDTAHNPASFSVLGETLRKKYSDRKVTAVIGMSKDKDAESSLAYLKNLVDKILFVKLTNSRSYALSDLKKIADNLNIISEVIEPQSYAFRKLHSSSEIDLGLIVGSFYLAGDYIKWRQDA